MNGSATQPITCDVLVIGSGAGGLAAAITARKLGLDVLVVEKSARVGGTTALSGGWLWIPCSPLATRAGIDDSIDDARRYIQHETGPQFDAARVDAFLENGPRMVDFFERETDARFLLGAGYPDYHPQQPGGRDGGRAICAMPFDGRLLGSRLADVQPPAREMTLFGLKVGSGPDFHHFANARRSPRSALYVARRVLAHFTDIARYGRDVLLMSGNALVGRLFKTAIDIGVDFRLAAPATRLCVAAGKVVGAVVMIDGQATTIDARRGVVCAAGGFPHDLARRRQLFRHAGAAAQDWSLAVAGDTGDGIRMAEAAGAGLTRNFVGGAAWMPVSRVPYRDGSTGLYPHSYERGKPGAIAVTPDGRRFANESNSYHDVVHALLEATPTGDEPVAYIVCDERFIRRYGLGMAKPFPLPLRPYLRSGYLARAASIEALATKIGVDAAQLAATVADFSRHAKAGTDPQFHRGENAYNRYQGDPDNTPNACLAPIVKPPFYAVRVVAGDLGTFMGLATDARARVLRDDATPVAGLYAVGTDMGNLFGGHYPCPGANLGPAMTFGYICAHELARSGG